MTALRAFFIAFLAFGCGKFTLSPYLADVDNTKLNQGQTSRIEALSAAGSDSFKVAVVSDTHNYYDELAEQVEFINKRSSEYAFVIIGGDLTNLGLYREFETSKKILGRLRIPYVTAIGNHDLLSNGGDVFEQMFGPRDFAFVFRQTKFVVFNNNNWESSGKVPDLGFIENELASSVSQNHVLIAHVSPDDKDRWSEEDKQEMRSLVNTYNVDYFLNGHDHNPLGGTFGNASRITIGASNKGKVLELRISNAGVEHEFLSF